MPKMQTECDADVSGLEEEKMRRALLETELDKILSVKTRLAEIQMMADSASTDTEGTLDDLEMVVSDLVTEVSDNSVTTMSLVMNVATITDSGTGINTVLVNYNKQKVVSDYFTSNKDEIEIPKDNQD